MPRVTITVPGKKSQPYRFQADRNPGILRAPLRLALRVGLALRSKVAVRAARKALNDEGSVTGDQHK